MRPLGSRWRGEVGLARVLWVDMLLIGTLVNLLATFAALIVASQGAPDPVAAIVHFAPLPLNLWLLMVVLRAKPRMPLARIVGVGWFVLMTVV